MKRISYIDNIRIALIALVIIHHTAIAYGASGGWCYVTPDKIKGWALLILSSFLTVNQAFFMSLFFFISAYFTPGSFDKKGLKKYLSDRFVRLGIPLLVYSILINPCLSYIILLHQGKVSMNLINYIINYNISNPNTSHLWFLLSLLIFESSYALYRILFRISIQDSKSARLPSQFEVFLFILITGFLAFMLRTVYPIGGKNIIGLQLGYFVLYTAMYILGIVANRRKWLEKLTFKSYRAWIILTFLIIPVIFLAWINVTRNPNQIIHYIGGLNLKALFLSYWEAFVCVGLILFFLTGFKRFINGSNTISIKMSADSYTAYIIHPVVIVGFTILFEMVTLQPVYKFLTVAVLSIFTSFVLARIIRMIPGIKRVI